MWIQLHELFNNMYWRSVIVIVLAVIATFGHEIDALKDGVISYMILIVLFLLIYTKEDMGLVMLVGVLFIISYNNVVHKNQIKQPNLVSTIIS